MAGLLNPRDDKQATPPGGMPQADQPPAAGGSMQPLAAGGEEEGNVTPEEQAQYDTFVTNGMQLIYNEKSMPQVLQSIAGDGDPVEGLANTVATVVMRLEDSAADKGQEISGDVKMHGATELLEQMAELAGEAGIHDYSEEEMEGALFRALDIYREARADRLPVDELKEDFAMLQEADQQGRLDEIVPGASEFAARRGGQQEQGQEQAPRQGLMR